MVFRDLAWDEEPGVRFQISLRSPKGQVPIGYLEFYRFAKSHHGAAEAYREFLLRDAAAKLFPAPPGWNIQVVLEPAPLYPGGSSTPVTGSNPRFGSVEVYDLR
jgi:hypothetical protein